MLKILDTLLLVSSVRKMGLQPPTRDLRNKAPRINLYDHVVERHAGDLNTKFKYEVVRVFHNDVLARQLEEGMRIENQQGISMNSQQEWNAPAVIQVSAYRMNRH